MRMAAYRGDSPREKSSGARKKKLPEEKKTEHRSKIDGQHLNIQGMRRSNRTVLLKFLGSLRQHRKPMSLIPTPWSSVTAKREASKQQLLLLRLLPPPLSIQQKQRPTTW